jgi:peroxiredoxin Q/BCP
VVHQSAERSRRVSIGEIAATVTTAIALVLAIGAANAEELVPGAMAPEFELVGSDGNTYRHSQFVGKQGVVLAWFPKAFTPG